MGLRSVVYHIDDSVVFLVFLFCFQAMEGNELCLYDDGYAGNQDISLEEGDEDGKEIENYKNNEIG